MSFLAVLFVVVLGAILFAGFALLGPRSGECGESCSACTQACPYGDRNEIV
jgi:epoxyqueuosine reductase QueG